MTSALGADRLHLARLEGVLDLAVQVAAVGDNDNPRVNDLVIKGKRATEHDHGQRFPRALGVPDHATFALAVQVEVLDPLHGPKHGEILLVTSDLADAAVEHRKATDEVEESVGAAKRVNRAVLGGDAAGAFGAERVKVGASVGEVAGVNGAGFGDCEGAVDEALKR